MKRVKYFCKNRLKKKSKRILKNSSIMEKGSIKSSKLAMLAVIKNRDAKNGRKMRKKIVETLNRKILT